LLKKNPTSPFLLPAAAPCFFYPKFLLTIQLPSTSTVGCYVASYCQRQFLHIG